MAGTELAAAPRKAEARGRAAEKTRDDVSPARALGRARYALAQTARVAWYMSHYLAARRLSGPITPPGEPAFTPKSAPGRQARIRDAFLDLFAQDRANIEAGLYPAPNDFAPDAVKAALEGSRRFFEDLPRLDARRMARDGVEVRSEVDERGRYPAYYLQNFHYQTGGWFTRDSARLYDMQVEVLFGGAADAMRRIALGALVRGMKGRDQRRTPLIDVACGNGRFLSQMLETFPRLPATGLDLSPSYADEARGRIARWPQAEIVVGKAESAPFETGAFQAATCVYLFHELPPRVRREVAAEIARLVAPGGVFVFADSLQTGDHRDLDAMLEYFPIGFHEPFYGSYLGEDLEAMFTAAGFVLEETRLAFLTKVMRFRRV
ncbi:MAG: methyltransferase domain-containing protein [Alphaproteobacteria bacterium]|nr:methyltransferase domain-containing protein [Alphaproteobacteria bacterium]